MPWESRLELLGVLLRVPPLFMIDSVLNRNFLSFVFAYDPNMIWSQFALWCCSMTFFLLLGVIMFVLSLRQLLVIYSYVINFAMLTLSYWWNYSFTLLVKEDHEDDMHNTYGLQREVYTHFMAQVLFAWIFCVSYSMRKGSPENNSFIKSLGIYISFLLPMVMQTVFQDDSIFQCTPLVALTYPLKRLSSNLVSSLGSLLLTALNTYDFVHATIAAIGIQAFVEDNWMRINVPRVLRVFCVARVIYQLSFYISLNYFENPPPQLKLTEEFFTENVTLIFQHLLIRSCETFVSLLGTTSVVSLLAHYIGIFMAFIVGSDTEEDRNMGTVTAILFFLLALQTGLTSLDPDKRRIRIFRNFCLLSAAILHFIHGMVNPILLAISASRSSPLSKHCRVLGMCVFLVIYPLCLINYLWQYYTASPWLLAVTAFSIEVIIKVFVSLTVYTLFIIDAYRDTFWEKLDDYIYCIQSTGNTIEFLFGIFMFCNGAWIMIFESGGFIRALMMCVHAYLNIFVQVKEGWKVFMRRRTAVHKINSLKEASTEDIATHNDVCAICYQELKSARITRCGHFFHSVCLRKWLYVQDNCPLCHEVIYKVPENGSADKASQTSDDVNIHDNGEDAPQDHPHNE